MRIFSALISVGAALSIPATSLAQTTPPNPPRLSLEIKLWETAPPGMIAGATEGEDDGTGRIRNVGIPGLTVHFPLREGENRGALIVCPGGGYHHLAISGSNNDAVTAFTPKNVVVIVLKYRTSGPYPREEIADLALADAKRAVRLVRQNARAWGIDPQKIGLLGWSAGSNLALNLASHFDSGLPESQDPTERFSSRPDCVALLCPWPFNKTIGDYPLSPQAPPAFIASALGDTTAPTDFARSIGQSYEKVRVPALLWVIEKGGHGAFHTKSPSQGAQWSQRLWDWLRLQAKFQ